MESKELTKRLIKTYRVGYYNTLYQNDFALMKAMLCFSDMPHLADKFKIGDTFSNEAMEEIRYFADKMVRDCIEDDFTKYQLDEYDDLHALQFDYRFIKKATAKELKERNSIYGLPRKDIYTIDYYFDVIIEREVDEYPAISTNYKKIESVDIAEEYEPFVDLYQQFLNEIETAKELKLV